MGSAFREDVHTPEDVRLATVGFTFALLLRYLPITIHYNIPISYSKLRNFIVTSLSQMTAL